MSGGFRRFGDFSADGQTIFYASTEHNGLDYDIYRADVANGSAELLFEGSYGGYMVNAVLALYPGGFQAGVSRYGVADWVTAPEIASPGLKASDRIEYGDISLPEWKSYYEINSPIRQTDATDVPVLYSHGVMDPRIDIAETETMVRALRNNGIGSLHASESAETLLHYSEVP